MSVSLKNVLEKNTATPEQVRSFVKELNDANDVLLQARQAYKEVLEGNDEIIGLKDQLVETRNQIKEYIAKSEVLSSYLAEIESAKKEKKILVATARENGVPQSEISEAIRMLKNDIDPAVTQDVYKNIADLIEI